MRHAVFPMMTLALLAGLANAQQDTGLKETPLTTAVVEDPHLWLEEVEGEEAPIQHQIQRHLPALVQLQRVEFDDWNGELGSVQGLFGHGF